MGGGGGEWGVGGGYGVDKRAIAHYFVEKSKHSPLTRSSSFNFITHKLHVSSYYGYEIYFQTVANLQKRTFYLCSHEVH